VKGAAKLFSWLFNSPETSALAVAYLTAKQADAGALIGPRALFGGWGYPKKNRILRKVKVGADELLHFTDKEISRKKRERKG
jgi:hypothetical protein